MTNDGGVHGCGEPGGEASGEGRSGCHFRHHAALGVFWEHLLGSAKHQLPLQETEVLPRCSHQLAGVDEDRPDSATLGSQLLDEVRRLLPELFDIFEGVAELGLPRVGRVVGLLLLRSQCSSAGVRRACFFF
jgi:hypothetical protein